MTDPLKDKELNDLEEKLQLRKALVDITNRIHAAQNIKQILVDLKDGILNLFNAFSMTIYVVDKPRHEIYSMLLSGAQVKEIRVPITNRSIAGFVANTGKIVNIGDAYDLELGQENRFSNQTDPGSPDHPQQGPHGGLADSQQENGHRKILGR
jgi:hypothetical protein